MLVLMAPWLLAAPIGARPELDVRVALSFIPPVNTFAMMIRLASTTPPPFWQVLADDRHRRSAAACARHLVRRQDLQGRPADARQAAELRDAHALGEAG